MLQGPLTPEISIWKGVCSVPFSLRYTVHQHSFILFLIGLMGGGVQWGPIGTAATNTPIVPATGDYDDGEIGGMIGRGSRSTRRKPTPVPLCPPQNPHAAQTRTRAAAVGSQRLTAWAKARPFFHTYNVYSHLDLMVTFIGGGRGNFNKRNRKLYSSSVIARRKLKTEGARIHFSQISLCRFRIPNTYFCYSYWMTTVKQVVQFRHQEPV
jgi:hypothetical protein